MNKIDELKKDIAAENGVYSTFQYIENSGYADVYFIGTHKGSEVIWNATLSTMEGEYYEKVNNIASDEAHEKYPYPDDEKLFTFKKIPGSSYSELINAYPEITDRKLKYISKRMMEIFDSGEVFIERNTIEIDESYEYGVGLHAHFDAPGGLNDDDVLNFIENFNKYGLCMFDDCNEPPITLTSEELGVMLYKDKFVVWKNGFSHNTVGINMDAMG
jgi:hypothetical protein